MTPNYTCNLTDQDIHYLFNSLIGWKNQSIPDMRLHLNNLIESEDIGVNGLYKYAEEISNTKTLIHA